MKFRRLAFATSVAFFLLTTISDTFAGTTSKVVYVADRTQNRIFIYPLDQATPIGSITNGIVEVQGIAVDKLGNLYVANGNGANVLEYAPGGRGPIKTYATGLSHPVNVTVDLAGNVYVAEQRPSSVVKFSVDSRVRPAVYPLPYPSDPVRGIAVDRSGDIYATISGLADYFPLAGSCLAVSGMYEIPFGTTTPVSKFLSSNEQEFGIAVNGAGTLYAADPCLNNVGMYGLSTFRGEGFFRYATTFNQPFYMTIANGFLSVPSAGEGASGYVTIVKLDPPIKSYFIQAGLQGPISAVVGSIPH